MPIARLLGASCAVAMTAAASGQYHFEYTRIALTNGPAFGFASQVFVNVGYPSINNHGAVAFRGRTAHVIGGIPFEGVFTWDSGVGLAVATQGHSLGGHPSLHYASFGDPIINDQGILAFEANYGPSNEMTSIIVGPPGDLRLTVLQSFAADSNGSYLSLPGQLNYVLLTRNGILAFPEGQVQVARVWSGLPGQLVNVAVPNQQAPGFPKGVLLTYFNSISTDLTGRILAWGETIRPGTRAQNVVVIAGPEEESQEILLAPGDAAPELTTAIGLSFGIGAQNGNGMIGISAVVTGAPEFEFWTAAWVGTSEELVPIAITNRQAPGFPAGWTFASDLNSPIPTPSGDAIFLSTVNGPGTAQSQAFWVYSDQLRLLSKIGDPVVNMPAGTTWWGTVASPGVAVNDLDQVCFYCSIVIPGHSPQYALLMADTDGRLYRVLTQGQTVEVAPGDVRTVLGVIGSPSGAPVIGMNGDNGLGTFLNDSGELALQIFFTDQTQGVFKARLVRE